MNKKIVFPAVALAVLGIGILGISNVSADDISDPHTALVQKIAEKFGVNQSDVQQVFDEVREEHHLKMQANFEERLTQAVSDGKITEEQKTLILNKHEELQTERQNNFEAWKDLTPEERRAQMEERHAELEAWAEENGIDLENFFVGQGPMSHHMRAW